VTRGWGAEGPPLIKIENLWFRYAGSERWALRGVSLEVERGEFVLILGGTGAGKSTLLRAMNGLIPHFYPGEMRGRVLVDGVDTREARVSELARKVGLVFQNPENQIVTLRVEREVAFGLENIGMSREEMRRRVYSTLKALGIENLAGRSTLSLSGGEKQLVAIASVLALGPDAIVLDEPTAELDPRNSMLVASVLAELNRSGKTVVIAEHRVDLFAPLASKIVVLKEGALGLSGDPREVFSRELLEEMGVSLPRTVEIWRELRVRGIRVEGPPLGEEECVDLLRELTCSG